MLSPYLRGFSRENLAKGLVAALVIGTLLTLVLLPLEAFLKASFAQNAADTDSISGPVLWLVLVVVWFLLITLFHAALHAFFAFLHEQGEAAFEKGNYRAAARYLYLFSLAANDHYDESGDAHRTLLACFLHLQRDRCAKRLVERCEKLGFETDLEAKD